MEPVPGFASTLSPRDLAYFVFKRKQQIAAVFTATFVLTTAAAYLVPQTFEAEAAVYVARHLPAIAAVTASRMVILDRREVLESEVELIVSRAVAEKVADIVAAQPAPPSRPLSRVSQGLAFVRERLTGWMLAAGLAEPPPDPRERLIRSIMGQVSATPARNSDFITISAVGENPEQAATLVNTITNVYLDERLILLHRPGLEPFYEQQVLRSRAELDELERQTRLLKNKTGIVAVEDQLRLKLEELGNLTNELNQVESGAHELRDKIAALHDRIGAQPMTVTASRILQRNPNISELEKKRLDLTAAMAVELNRFQPDSPPIQDIERNLARVRDALAAEPATILTSESVTENSVRTTLQSDLYRSESDYTAKLARARTLETQIAAVKQQVGALDSDAGALRRLATATASAAKIYQTYIEERETARIAQQTDPGITNVQVVHRASTPTVPRFPRTLLILFGAFLGLFLGVSVAFVGELFGQTLDRRDDVERSLGLPLLASVPESRSLRLKA
jgi:uncharacterized protein involved in exopolysaccharide biosynthesis